MLAIMSSQSAFFFFVWLWYQTAQSYQITWIAICLKSFCVLSQPIFCLGMSFDAVRIKLLKCHIRCQCHRKIKKSSKEAWRARRCTGQRGCGGGWAGQTQGCFFLLESSEKLYKSEDFKQCVVGPPIQQHVYAFIKQLFNYVLCWQQKKLACLHLENGTKDASDRIIVIKVHCIFV